MGDWGGGGEEEIFGPTTILTRVAEELRRADALLCCSRPAVVAAPPAPSASGQVGVEMGRAQGGWESTKVRMWFRNKRGDLCVLGVSKGLRRMGVGRRRSLLRPDSDRGSGRPPYLDLNGEA